jgi:dolichol-phosphate mannosyltransferase
VEDILRAVERHTAKVLVINDGSTDGTGLLLEKCACLRLITHDTNIGYGRSLLDAFSYARARGFAWIITMDCDHQHEPRCLPRFFREIRRGKADIISGSRYLRPIDPGAIPPPPERVTINRTITALLNRHLGLRLTDAFCGFKAYRVGALTELRLSETGYGLPMQLWVQASHAGLRIREIPVPLIYHDRRRNFAGVLENPATRMQYYLAIIERELGYDIGDEIEELFRIPEVRECLGRS